MVQVLHHASDEVKKLVLPYLRKDPLLLGAGLYLGFSFCAAEFAADLDVD